MKRIIQGIAIVVLAVVTLTAHAISDENAFEEYNISQLEEFADVDAKATKAWVLSYAEECPIVITMQQGKRCNTYMVRSDHFEVTYECSKKGFGARHVNLLNRNASEEVINKVFNRSALSNQRVLTPSKIDDDKALKLIAAYLPELVNPDYKHHLLN